MMVMHAIMQISYSFNLFHMWFLIDESSPWIRDPPQTSKEYSVVHLQPKTFQWMLFVYNLSKDESEFVDPMLWSHVLGDEERSYASFVVLLKTPKMATANYYHSITTI